VRLLNGLVNSVLLVALRAVGSGIFLIISYYFFMKSLLPPFVANAS
jgi:hypothetical protein